MKLPFVRALLSILLFGAGTPGGYAATGGHPMLPDFTVIDRQEPAYTIFIGISKDKLVEIQAQIANLQNVEIVSWEKFQQNPEHYIKARIVKNEYAESRVVAGIIALLKTFVGTPIGLTWNGGVAITYNDYQYAQKIHQQYQANPDEYERTRNRDPKADPLNPGTQFQGLLGNAFRNVTSQEVR
jgi:hypothetical protein